MSHENGIVFSITRELPYYVDITDYNQIVEHLECTFFTVAYRTIGNRHYTIYCDDVGLLKEHPVITYFGSDNDILVGNIIVAGYPMPDGTTAPLSKEDMYNILSHAVPCWNTKDGTMYPVLMNNK